MINGRNDLTKDLSLIDVIGCVSYKWFDKWVNILIEK